MLSSSPQPAVIHIVTLFRQIAAGDIRIPAFQREFIWTNRQIIELLESVQIGYPIGSILLWYVDKAILKIASSSTTSFPDIEEKYPTSYVLDGMQRLSSLYGVFHYGASSRDEKFNVWFDLDIKAFFHESDLQIEQRSSSVPLSALFNPRQLLEHQARLAALPEGDLYIGQLLDLQASFQAYMVPVVSIRGEDVERVVGIFEKINSTGTPLDTVDFMRAITWAQDFDLSHHLDDISSWLSEYRFWMPDETIIKCIGLILDIPPTPEELLRLRRRSPQDLSMAFQKLKPCFYKIMEFLDTNFKIRSSEYVPYEGQTLVLLKAIGMEEADGTIEHDELAQWFWATGFNESLRGKPDHYVVRAVENWKDLIKGRIRGLEPRLRLTPDDFIERRLIKGKALSAAFASMLAVHEARSLKTGKIIDPASYMSGGDSRFYVPIFSSMELAEARVETGPSPRLLANIVVENWSGIKRAPGNLNIRSYIEERARKGDMESLRSQFIDESAASDLSSGDVYGFLIRRSYLLYGAAQLLVEG